MIETPHRASECLELFIRGLFAFGLLMRLHEGRDSVSDIALSILVVIVTHGARLQVSIIELKGACGNLLAGRLLGSSRARIEDLVELGFCRFLKAGMQRIACVVHQVVEPVASPALQCLADFGDETVKGANVTGVERKSRRFPSYGFGLANETLSFFLIRAIG